MHCSDLKDGNIQPESKSYLLHILKLREQTKKDTVIFTKYIPCIVSKYEEKIQPVKDYQQNTPKITLATAYYQAKRYHLTYF